MPLTIKATSARKPEKKKNTSKSAINTAMPPDFNSNHHAQLHFRESDSNQIPADQVCKASLAETSHDNQAAACGTVACRDLLQLRQQEL